jgi:integrase
MTSHVASIPGAKATDPTEARIAPQLQALAVPLDSLIPHPRNPRRGDVSAIAASLARFGQRKPVVVQATTRYVVAGNHLAAAARTLGWTEIAANVQDMDDTEATAFMLADNRTADLGGYDDALLAEILAEQGSLDNLWATGYDEDAVAALLRAAGVEDARGDPDDAPDRPAAADLYVLAGDLWSLGPHRLVVGDATDPAAVARLTAGARIDLRDQALVAVLITTAARNSSVRLLRLEDIDLDRAIIRFRRAKGGKTLEIALHGDARTALVRYLERGRPALLAGSARTRPVDAVDEGGWLFVSWGDRSGQPLSANALSLMLTRRYHAGGGSVRVFGSHRIRHATATLLVNNGMPLEEVSRYLGHSSTDVTRRYAQQTTEALGQRAAAALVQAGLVSG